MVRDLERFVAAQDRGGGYETALREIRDGAKRTHWIWWVFPQLVGLGRSETSREFGVDSLDEAIAYVEHPVLGPRLRAATKAMLEHQGSTASSILHGDDVKFRSSMTLFARASRDNELFLSAISQFFDAEGDPLTEQLLAKDR